MVLSIRALASNIYRVDAALPGVVFAVDISRRMMELRGRAFMWTTPLLRQPCNPISGKWLDIADLVGLEPLALVLDRLDRQSGDTMAL